MLPRSLTSVLLPLAAFGVLWADLIRQLSYTWDTREQYAYGWFVPVLVVGLLWRNWATRPLTCALGSLPSTSSVPTSDLRPSTSRAPRWLSALVGILVASLLPLRVIIEINPDWPLITWVYGSTVVALSLYAVHLAGGWPWVKHFGFPVCFILVAVAWPFRIEKALTQNLMQIVARLTVEVCGWLDIPALQKGNLIEVATGTVGIDEACSGIRSFQSTFMASLFLGELYLLTWPRRLLLVPAGLVVAFCLNVVRTLILTWQAAKSGVEAVGKWHDPAGFTIFFVTFGCLWLLALLIRGRSSEDGGRRPEVGDRKPEVALPTSDLRPLTSDLCPPPASGRFPRRFLLAVGCWTVCCLGLTEAWYRSHDLKKAGTFFWTVQLPETKPGFEKITPPPRTVKLLAADLSMTGKWREDDGSEWSAYFFRWKPRSIQSVIMSRMHRPEVCLAAAGLRQISESEPVLFQADKLNLPFRKYTFESEGRTIFVFFCQWEDGAEQQTGMRASKQADRLQSVLTGRRKLGQQTLELMLTGYSTLAEAETAVRGRLMGLVRASNE